VVEVVAEAEAGIVAVVAEARRVAAGEAALEAAGEARTEEARTVEHFQLHTARPETGAGFFLCLRYLRDHFFARPLLLTTLGQYRCLQEQRPGLS
jgi:hypothetical protein